MRVMLLGAGGLVGTALIRCRPHGMELTALPHADLDITRRRELEHAIRRARPEVIVNAAAYTAVDRAESDPEAAFAVNAAAVGTLGLLGAALGVRVLHLGTDFVFDGELERPYREDDAPAPLNVYGRSKLAGEAALTASGVERLVVRTQSLFGPGGPSFIRTMARRAREAQPSRVIADQYSCPTFTMDLAGALWQLVALGTTGVVHAANTGAASWYEVAARVYASFGRTGLCVPCTTAEYPTPAVRPRFSCLDTTRLAHILGAPLPHWSDAVDRFLASGPDAA